MSDNEKVGSSKKKLATSAIAVGLAVALLVGSTVSYERSDSGDETENDFDLYYNSVDLSETNGATGDEEVSYEFNVIPDTSEMKDPTVTATYMLDSYVFLLVDDDTYDLVEYEILTTDNGGVWELLYEEDDEDNPYYGEYAVYYTIVSADTADDTKTGIDSEGESYTYYEDVIKVLVDDTVSYDYSLTNEDMFNEDGELIGDVSLSFKALIIQATPFNALSDDEDENAATALSAFLGDYPGTDDDDDTDDTNDGEAYSYTYTVTVSTTIASNETDGFLTTTEFTLKIPETTEITSVSDSISSVYLVVSETTSEDIDVDMTFASGDYTFDICVVDQDGERVYAVSDDGMAYMIVSIGIRTVISDLSVVRIEDDYELPTVDVGDDYYTYDPDTGLLSIYSSDFGEYQISWSD